jgi:hypothetical protein
MRAVAAMNTVTGATRTPTGHRRFKRSDVEALLRQQ